VVKGCRNSTTTRFFFTKVQIWRTKSMMVPRCPHWLRSGVSNSVGGGANDSQLGRGAPTGCLTRRRMCDASEGLSVIYIATGRVLCINPTVQLLSCNMTAARRPRHLALGRSIQLAPTTRGFLSERKFLRTEDGGSQRVMTFCCAVRFPAHLTLAFTLPAWWITQYATEVRNRTVTGEYEAT
jgi:hypothetical protein